MWNNEDDAWNTDFEEFRTAVLATGWCSVNSEMARRSSEYRRATLKPYQRELLDNINFPWDPRAQAWDTNFRKVQAYIKDHGSLSGAPKQLRSWIGARRKGGPTGEAHRAQTLAIVVLAGAYARAPNSGQMIGELCVHAMFCNDASE